MATILGKTLCIFGIHKKEVYLWAKAKQVHTGKDKKYYRSVRFDIYRVIKCSKCGKVFDKIKLKSDLKEQQARIFMNNYIDIIY